VSLSSYIVDHLTDLEEQWAVSLRTLPPGDLAAQREALRAKCEGRTGVSPSTLVLALLDGVIARREAGR
jgi:hypothetical protein